MKFGLIPVEKALGAILAHGVRHGDGVFKKGRVVSQEDIAALQAAEVREVTVAQLEERDVGEDNAARQLAVALAGQGVTAQQAFTGRANLHASTRGLLVVDAARANAINHLDESLTLATLPSHTAVSPKQMLATVKVIPFAVDQQVLADALHTVDGGPLLHVVPFLKKKIGLVITTVPQSKSSVVAKSETSVRERLQVLGLDLNVVLTVAHKQSEVEAAIRSLHVRACDCILVFGGSAIVDRGDVIPAALGAAGGNVIHLGMPVDPGNLLMLGQLDDIPVLGVPSCARSPKRNGFDWVLERVLAGLEVTRDDIMDMGVGGLLAEIPSRPSPREMQVPTAPRVVAVVLAAGLGKRMGSSKMLVDYNGKTMIAATVQNVLASGVDDVIVVTGHESEKIIAALKDEKARFVHNPDYETGMASSLRAGVEAATGADAVIICLGDMPRVSSAVIDRLIAAFNPTEHRSIVVPTHNGQFGNPVLWGQEHFRRLMTMQGDRGARSLIGDLKSEATEIEADAGVLLDADTPEDLAKLKSVASS